MTDAPADSILNNTKKMLGLDVDYPAFDLDVTIHINSVFGVLHQLGVGPFDTEFEITGPDEAWSDFIEVNSKKVSMSTVKSYMYLAVRLLFDPPQTSYDLAAKQALKAEYEWRLNVDQEEVRRPLLPPLEPLTTSYDPTE